jgi:putative holliday junction resolvase
MSVTPDLRLETDSISTCRLVLGFDFGFYRIGVAVGETITRSVHALWTISNLRKLVPDWDTIIQLVSEWQPDWLVVGVPHHSDGTYSAMTKAAIGFSKQLHTRFCLPVDTIDEHLSSWEAKHQFHIQQCANNHHRRRNGNVRLDARAAAVILESWLNQIGDSSDNA